MSDRAALIAGLPATGSFAREHDIYHVVSDHGCRAVAVAAATISEPDERRKPRPAVTPADVGVAKVDGGIAKFDGGIAEVDGGIATKVLRSFNTWAFKREQPSDPQLMLRYISTAIEAEEAVPFVLYWGKGPRNLVDVPDGQCLDFLAALASRVSGVYPPGAAIKLIFTDTHAELNGQSPHDIRQYFDGVELLARQRGIGACWMGELVKAAGDLATAAPLEEPVPATLLSTLTASALKWYHGDDTAAAGALKYLRMNLIEQRVVERAFHRSIFVSFNGSKLRSLFPRQLPVFYMYSLRRGTSIKPWFLPADGSEFNADSNPERAVHYSEV